MSPIRYRSLPYLPCGVGEINKIKKMEPQRDSESALVILLLSSLSANRLWKTRKAKF